jgi:hypothetical protein
MPVKADAREKGIEEWKVKKIAGKAEVGLARGNG